MKNKGFTLIELLVAIVILAVVIMVALVKPVGASEKGCGGFWEPSCNTQNTQKKEAQLTEENQRRLLQAVPVPKLETSQERVNLVKRLERFNNADKVSYIYLVNYGKVMAFYTIKGKVSSVNSMLTTTEQIVNKDGGQCSWSGSSSYDCYVVASPDIDGSYGSNGDAIFFFTTEDAYVEWQGDYMLADQPLKLTTQPELVRQIQ